MQDCLTVFLKKYFCKLILSCKLFFKSRLIEFRSQYKIWAKASLPYLGIFIALAACYNTVFRYGYAHHDEVNFFLYGKTYILHSVRLFVLSMGRFIGAYIATGLNYLVNSLFDLKVTRFFMIVQLWISACILMRWLKSHFLSKRDAFLFSVALFTLPSFEIMASFAAGFNNSTGVWMGLLSGVLAFGMSIEGTILSRIKSKSFIFSVIFFILGLMAYQPSAVIFWIIPALVILFSSLDKFEETKQRLINIFVSGFFALGIYFLILQVFKKMLSQIAGGYNPYSLSTDYFGKIYWFFSEAVSNCLNFWNVFPKSLYVVLASVFIGFLTLVILTLRIKRAQESKEVKSISIKIIILSSVFLSCLFLSFLPNLLSTGNFAFYRCLSGPATIILALLVWGIWRMTQILKFQSRNVFSLLLAILMIFGLLRAHHNVFRYIVFPGYIEMDVMKNVLRNEFETYKRIHIIHADQDKLKTYYDEFGLVSSSMAQNRLGLVSGGYTEIFKQDNMFLYGILFDFDLQEAEFLFVRNDDRESGLAFKKIITSSAKKLKTPFDEPTLVIDMTRLYKTGAPLEYLLIP